MITAFAERKLPFISFYSFIFVFSFVSRMLHPHAGCVCDAEDIPPENPEARAQRLVPHAHRSPFADQGFPLFAAASSGVAGVTNGVCPVADVICAINREQRAIISVSAGELLSRKAPATSSRLQSTSS